MALIGAPSSTALFILILVSTGDAISQISATNASVSGRGSTDCLSGERACSCPQSAIMKCFCPNESYFLEFHLGRLQRAFDLLQLGACRQLTLYGLPFSAQPPEFVQFFDVENLFHDRTFEPPPPFPFPEVALPSSSRPIRRVEFLNVTVAYLALSDFFSLNTIELFIIQNSTVKVLGGRPKNANFTSTIRNLQILSSRIIELRRNAVDVASLDSFAMTNSTVHVWQSSAVRLRMAGGDAPGVFVTNCSVHRMDAAAITVLSPTRLLFDANRFFQLSDGAIRLLLPATSARVEVSFVNNLVDWAHPRALVAFFRDGIRTNFSLNTFPCNRTLCLGDDFHLVGDNFCGASVDGSAPEGISSFTDSIMAPWTTDACVPNDQDENGQPQVHSPAFGHSAMPAVILGSALFTLLTLQQQ